MKTNHLSPTLLDQLKSWCLLPIGMTVILIVVAAIGIVIGMAIKEDCAESDLSYRIFRTLYIAGYICFVLIYANTLLTSFCTAVTETIGKILAAKWSATIFAFVVTAVFFGFAILIYGLQQPSDVRSYVFSAPFWIAGSLPLIICAAAFFYDPLYPFDSIWWIIGAALVEILAFCIATCLASNLAWLVRKEQDEKETIEDTRTDTTENETGNDIIDNILAATSQATQRI